MLIGVPASTAATRTECCTCSATTRPAASNYEYFASRCHGQRDRTRAGELVDRLPARDAVSTVAPVDAVTGEPPPA